MMIGITLYAFLYRYRTGRQFFLDETAFFTIIILAYKGKDIAAMEPSVQGNEGVIVSFCPSKPW
jgi:hypothetical protein